MYGRYNVFHRLMGFFQGNFLNMHNNTSPKRILLLKIYLNQRSPQIKRNVSNVQLKML